MSFCCTPTVPSLTLIYHSPPFFSLTYGHCLKCRVIANKLVNEEAISGCQRAEEEYFVVLRRRIILHKLCQLFFDLFQKVALIGFSVPSIPMQKHLLLNSSLNLKDMTGLSIEAGSRQKPAGCQTTLRQLVLPSYQLKRNTKADNQIKLYRLRLHVRQPNKVFKIDHAPQSRISLISSSYRSKKKKGLSCARNLEDTGLPDTECFENLVLKLAT